MPASVKQSAEEKKRMAEYQAEDDLRTLARAAEIKADPQRMRAARAKAKKQMKELNAVTSEKD